MSPSQTAWWRKHPLPLIIFIAIAGYFLWSEHGAHIDAFLPWILLLCCVVMHLFMHGGHGHPSSDDTPARDDHRGDRP